MKIIVTDNVETFLSFFIPFKRLSLTVYAVYIVQALKIGQVVCDWRIFGNIKSSSKFLHFEEDMAWSPIRIEFRCVVN